MAVRRTQPSQEGLQLAELVGRLNEEDMEAVAIETQDDLGELSEDALPDLALLDTASMSGADIRRCVGECARLKLPVIAIVQPHRLADMELAMDDFLTSPVNHDELVARARRVTRKMRPQSGELLRYGELVINPTSYEVLLRGKRVNLRFKEYELLRLLAANPGRVYTREALLSRIWGYDYLGGTRTVDVHIRRLRSKIEDSEHQFIETIWNVGYRFMAEAKSDG